MIIDDDDYLAHYGVLRRSGRYPWGSGKSPSVHNKNLLFHVEQMKKQGMSEPEIAKGLGLTTTQLRAEKTIAINQQRQEKITMAQKLKDKGYSNGAIAERMGLPGESSVRALLAPGVAERADVATKTAAMLKDEVDSKGFIDVGTGVDVKLGIASTKLDTSIEMLRQQGYEVHTVPNPQIGTGFETRRRVLCPPGTTWADVRSNQDKIQNISAFTDDGGHHYEKPHPPLSIDPKRVEVRYSQKNAKGEEIGGGTADGVIYVRRGVEDVSIGDNRYAQVRIKVGDNHYLKGMAMYHDDLPPGVDLVFHTSKEKKSNNKLDAMKEISDDPDYPFGSVVRQIIKDPGTPNARVTSVMNLVGSKEGSGEEGYWGGWSRTLSTQMLSKQSPSVARSQLDLTHERRKKEFDEIMSLTNPTVKKKLLQDFADSTDSSANHLDAAAFKGQAWHVILPINSLSPRHVYAPNFKDGETVVLIRYPHGGTFEIPELTVNNKNREGRRLLGDTADAIGIHHSVAQHLSGADFDGDTVLVIPNRSGRIKTSPALAALKDFDPRAQYAPYHGMKTIDGGVYNAHTGKVDYGPKGPSKRGKGIQMGDVSNLITDMTIKGASHEEIARAVKHSMVVIDSEKHHLDWKRSAQENGIAALKREYQGGPRSGASTLISRATREVRVPDRRPRPAPEGGPIDKSTGARVFVPTGRMTRDRHGNTVPRMTKSTELAETSNAHTLSSGTRMEHIYAEHSNRLKTMANEARLASINTPRLEYSPSAKKAYASEVSSLSSKLALAKMNAPKERQAQSVAKAQVQLIKDANPNLKEDQIKKIEYRELEKARARLGARKRKIEIEPKEWDAIQAGAISDHQLSQILTNADMDIVRSYATPRRPVLMTPTATRRAQAMLDAGHTRAEVAAQLGVSLTTLDNATNG